MKVDGHDYNRVLYLEDLEADQVLRKMDDLHSKRFYELVDSERNMDIYRETLFYLVSGNDELYEMIKADIARDEENIGKMNPTEGVPKVYDFYFREVYPYAFDYFEGSSKALMELALQLYTDVYPTKDQYQIFRRLNAQDLKLAWMAIAIRYDIDIE